MLLGRELTWNDARERARVVVVNEAYAVKHWGAADAAIGKRVAYCCNQWHEIVGVVPNVYDNGLSRAPAEIVYWPLAVDGFWAVIPGSRDGSISPCV